ERTLGRDRVLAITGRRAHGRAGVDQEVHDHLALGREAAHEEHVEPPEQVPVEMAQVVARCVRRVRFEFEAGGLRAARKATLARPRAHAPADGEHQPGGARADAGRGGACRTETRHRPWRAAEASTRSTTVAASIPSVSAANVRTSRWRSAARTTRSTSS